MCERRLAVRAPGDDTSRNAHRLAFFLFLRRLQRDRIGREVRPIEGVRKWRDAPRLERLQLRTTRALDEVQIVGHLRGASRAGRTLLCKVRFYERIDVPV